MNTTSLAMLVTIIAGVAVAFQATFNNILSKYIGVWTANSIVHGTGFFVAVAVTLVLGKNQIMAIGGAPWYSLLGGTLGVGIIASVIFAIGKLNIGLTFTLLMVSQIITAALIDHYGWLGGPVILLDYKKMLGICFLVLGAILIKK
jgi:transporter family-2 protein